MNESTQLSVIISLQDELSGKIGGVNNSLSKMSAVGKDLKSTFSGIGQRFSTEFGLIEKAAKLGLAGIVAAGAGIIAFGKNIYGNEVQAIFLVIIVSMVFRFIAFMYSRKIVDRNKTGINLYKSIILQKPVAYSVKHFWHVLSYQERRILHRLRSSK